MDVSVLRTLARAGYGARGAVYLVVGGLALAAGFGGGGEATDSKGAITRLMSEPAGNLLVIGIGVGLLGHAGWRVVQALADADRHGTDLKGLTIRGGLLVSAVTHGLLAAYAFGLALGFGAGGGDGSRGMAAWLMQQPFGPWLVGLVGLALAGAGVAQVVKGLRRGYRRHLDSPPALLDRLDPVCTAGLVARGAVFGIVAGLFLYAAWTVDPSQAGGVDDALRWLQTQPYGGWLLVLLALGLVAFGLYSLVLAAWRRIDAPDIVPDLPVKAGASG